jgi:hypothetical protein
MKYTIASAGTVESLEKEVNACLKNGYVSAGSMVATVTNEDSGQHDTDGTKIFFSKVTFYQSLVKIEPSNSSNIFSSGFSGF